MARKFAEVWRRIAKNETVTITCPKRGVKAISAAIYNEKYRHQRARKATDLPGYGRIEITQEPVPDDPKKVQLKITVKYSGDNL